VVFRIGFGPVSIGSILIFFVSKVKARQSKSLDSHGDLEFSNFLFRKKHPDPY